MANMKRQRGTVRRLRPSQADAPVPVIYGRKC